MVCRSHLCRCASGTFFQRAFGAGRVQITPGGLRAGDRFAVTDLGLLGGNVSTLQGEIGSLSADVTSLQDDVLGLCGTLPLACS
jgi:hypothetical protein